VHGIATAAGVDFITPHVLRKSFATHMARAQSKNFPEGAPHVAIKKLLGHSKLSTTMRYIAAASPQRLRSSYDKARQFVAAREEGNVAL
jgi:integrase